MLELPRLKTVQRARQLQEYLQARGLSVGYVCRSSYGIVVICALKVWPHSLREGFIVLAIRRPCLSHIENVMPSYKEVTSLIERALQLRLLRVKCALMTSLDCSHKYQSVMVGLPYSEDCLNQYCISGSPFHNSGPAIECCEFPQPGIERRIAMPKAH